jgi:hypothetical protein
MSFADMIDQLFADPLLGADASFQTGASAPYPIRLMVKQPDEVLTFGGGQIHTSQTLFDVRAWEVPVPQEGDKIVHKGVTYIIQSEPKADRERLVWRLDVRAE